MLRAAFYARILTGLLGLVVIATPAHAASSAFTGQLYDPGQLKPVDSVLKVEKGDTAPDFTLRAVSGRRVTLSDLQGKKNVMLTFVPAAWTPVCSDQWPGYNIAQKLFDRYDTTVIGISTDNIPTLYSWTKEMGTLWFEVVSDFWPHGEVSSRYGVLRTDGTSERAIFIIDRPVRRRFIFDLLIRHTQAVQVMAIGLGELAGRGSLDAEPGHS